MSLYQNPFEPINKRLCNIESLLLDIKHNPDFSSQKDVDNPVDISEACELIGKSKPTIYGMVSRREIPHHKKGNRLYFFRDEIIDWIKTGKQKTHREIKADTDVFLSNKKKAK